MAVKAREGLQVDGNGKGPTFLYRRRWRAGVTPVRRLNKRRKEDRLSSNPPGRTATSRLPRGSRSYKVLGGRGSGRDRNRIPTPMSATLYNIEDRWKFHPLAIVTPSDFTLANPSSIELSTIADDPRPTGPLSLPTRRRIPSSNNYSKTPSPPSFPLSKRSVLPMARCAWPRSGC